MTSLEILRGGLDLDRFFTEVGEAPSRVLILDYDGTLAPFTEDRERAFPWPEAADAVRRVISAGGCRVVVVSGRALDVLRRLLGLEPTPELWGSHGWERWTPEGGAETGEPGDAAREGLDFALGLARQLAAAERVEVKPVSVAVHTRGMPPEAAAAMLDAVRPAWERAARDAGLEVHAFDGGLEVRVPGRDKGTAVEAILASEPEGTVVAYLGDDLTDEDAFRALGRGRHRALRVLVRAEPRETRADVRLEPPEELVTFLDRWRRAATAR